MRKSRPNVWLGLLALLFSLVVLSVGCDSGHGGSSISNPDSIFEPAPIEDGNVDDNGDDETVDDGSGDVGDDESTDGESDGSDDEGTDLP